MSLIESARDFVKGLVEPGPGVGEHETATAVHTGETPEQAAATARLTAGDAGAADEVERMRREWESEPSHH